MDIQAFLNGLDKLFVKKAIDEVEPFLNERTNQLSLPY